jgi:NTP pyrophosphatase (non-canonical NTP hydrolase)
MGNRSHLSVAELQHQVADFNQERGWEDVHTVESLCKAISVEAGELLEVTLWPKAGQISRDDLLSEMADVAIYLLSLSNLLGIQLDEAIQVKLAGNSSRFPRIS